MEKDKNLVLSIDNAEFSCKVFGRGAKKIIAFHGFGQDAGVFGPFADNNPEYTFYCFDLPFHGDTKIADPTNCLSDAELIRLTEILRELESLDRFSMFGFSIGAKLIFPVIKRFSDKIDAIFLMAPDGIKPSFWYRYATSTAMMRRIFRFVMKRPVIICRGADILYLLKTVDKKTLRFVKNSLLPTASGDRVYHTWVYLRKLKPDMDTIALLINRDAVKTTFIIGAFDQIIPERSILLLSRKLKAAKIKTLPCGHQSLFGKSRMIPLEDLL